MSRIFILIVLLFAFSVPVFADDASTTPEPTVAPVATEAPPVVIVTPPPVDVAQLPEWGFLVIIVLALGLVSVASVGIIQMAKKLPDGGRAIVTGAVNSGLDQLGNYVGSTPSLLDDAVFAEFRQKVLDLEKQMNEVPGQTARAIQVNNSVQAENAKAISS